MERAAARQVNHDATELTALRAQVPEPSAAELFSDPAAYEEAYGGKDYGAPKK